MADRASEWTDRRWWLVVLLLGLSIRLALAPLTGEGDLVVDAEASVSMLYGQAPYTYIVVYPPAWVLLLNVYGHLTALVVPANQIVVANPHLQLLNLYLGSLQPADMSHPLYGLVEKIPLFAFDLLTGWLLYRIILEAGKGLRAARAGFAVWFLNPLVIAVSAVHGGYDVMPVFFGLAGVYLAIARHPLFAGITLGLGVTLKIFPVFFVPLTLAIFFRNRVVGDWRPYLRAVGMFAAGVGADLLLVFWPPGLFASYYTYLTTGPSVGQSFGGLGEYSFLSIPSLEGARRWFFYHDFVVGSVASAIAIVLILLAAACYAKTKGPATLDAGLAHVLLVTGFAVFLPFSILQSQYLIWIAPAFILAGLLDGRYRFTYWAISLLTLTWYLLGIAGPLYFLEPVAVFTPYLPVATVQQNILFWIPYDPWIRVFTGIPVFLLLLGTALRSWRAVLRGAFPRGL